MTDVASQIKVHIDADKSDARPGDPIFFTVTLKNLSAATISNFSVLYSYAPAQLAVLESDGESLNGSVRWTIDTLQPGQKRALRIRTQLSPLLQQGDDVHATAIATVNGVAQESAGSFDIRAITQLPTTGPSDNLLPLENTSRYLFPMSGNSTAVSATVWAAIIVLGVTVASAARRKYFL